MKNQISEILKEEYYIKVSYGYNSLYMYKEFESITEAKIFMGECKLKGMTVFIETVIVKDV